MHLLTNRSTLAEVVMTVWSFQRFFGRDRWPVVVHDDGSFTRKDHKYLASHLPGVTVLDARERRARVLALLADKPRCAALRASSYVHCQKLFDTQVEGRGTTVLQLDTDLLCHEPPTALLEAAHAAPWVDRYNRDVPTWYGYAWPDMPIPDAINAGLILYRHPDLRFDEYERWLGAYGPPQDPYVIEQTLWALDLVQRGAQPLPDSYDVAFRNERIGQHAVTQHYCGGPVLRDLYYAEATRVLAEQRPVAP